MPSGETLEEAYRNATATIGEKISSVVLLLVEKQMLKHLVHTNTMVAVSVLSQLLMVVTKLLQNKSQCTLLAMKPTVLFYTELDEQFVKDELAKINHKIEQRQRKPCNG